MGLFRRNGHYLDGADLVTPQEVIDDLIEQLGEPEKAPRGILFSRDHLLDQQGDVDGNCPTLAKLKDFDYEYCEPGEDWQEEVNDCDNLTATYCTAVGKGCKRERMNRGIIRLDLWYVSRSIGDQKEKWGGYHSAPLLYVKNKEGKRVFVIRQPATYNYLGAWQNPKSEVKFWVNAPGRY